MSKQEKVIRLKNEEERLLTEKQYKEYILRLKAHDEKSWLGTMSLTQRMRFHGMLRLLLHIDLLKKGIKVKKLNCKLPDIPDGKPVIFVLTHVGCDDIAVFSEVVREHCTILSGDYENLHNNIQGFAFALNGTVFFDMKSQEERSSVENKVAKVLRGGDNILCSMEAAWNLSANELVMELFPGMIRAAKKSYSVIIPVGIERFSCRLYGINIAKEIVDPCEHYEKYEEEELAVEQARTDLRHIMAELKFQIYYESYIHKRITASRKSIGDYNSYNEKFKADILKGWMFTEEMVNEKKYRNKAKPQYAFSYVVDKFRFHLKKSDDKLVLCELVKEIQNPVYPTCITESLKQLLEQST